MKNATKLILLFELIAIGNANANTRRVLFIGNSYIYTNNMPAILSQLAGSLGDTLIYDQSTPGGYTLEAHSTDMNTINKIYSQQWDVVVIQEQSQRPAFPPTQVESDTYPYAHILDSLVHDNNACSETMFMMTWGYKNGDPSNCGSYPVICTYEGMQQRLRESYLEMTMDNNANVAPVGAAWKMTRDSFPGIELYSTDNSHPIVAGSYLEACVLYSSIFHKSSTSSSYYGGLADTIATKLQTVASHVVMDSLNNWQQYGDYVFADFSLSINDKTITLQNFSTNATSYAWNFGDMNTDNSAIPAPHTYAGYGQYTVTLSAYNTCLGETREKTINLSPVSVSEMNGTIKNVLVFNKGYGNVELKVTNTFRSLSIHNINGQTLYVSACNSCDHKLNLPAGIYIYTVERESRSERASFIVK